MKNEIILYSTDCPRCIVLKEKLNDKGVAYEINNSVEEMKSLGIDEVPILAVDGTFLNFSSAVSWVNSL